MRHFYWTANFDNTYEWYYEGDSKEVLIYIYPKTESPEDTVSIGVHNWPYGSFAYYGDTKYAGKIKVKWSPVEKDTSNLYLYVSQDLLHQVHERYRVEKKFKHGVLFIKE